MTNMLESFLLIVTTQFNGWLVPLHAY
jgi:hypothetical protein